MRAGMNRAPVFGVIVGDRDIFPSQLAREGIVIVVVALIGLFIWRRGKK